VAALSNETNLNTCLGAHKRPNNPVQGYVQVYILQKISGLTHRLLRALKMTESRGKDYFDTEKLIIEAENIFWDKHKGPHIFY
jgi:hypothetical protein